eukprot:augustus_masked-scaffold_15-processed-gene-0.49-mRNA-1 protein AED:0.30 eAED:0.30 QI:0/-1/0/1/-1/1/1/0/683
MENICKDLDIIFDEVPASYFTTNGMEDEICTALEISSTSGIPKDVQNLRTGLRTFVTSVRLYHESFLEEEHKFSLCAGDFENTMKLDLSVLVSLNVFNGLKERKLTDESLYGLLNKCCTKKIGSDLLEEYLRQPTRDIHEIKRRQDIVGFFFKNESLLYEVRRILKGFPNIAYLLKRLEQKKLSLKEFYLLYLFVSQLKKLVDALDGEKQTENYLVKLRELLSKEKLDKFCSLVSSLLNLSLAPEEFRVNSEHDNSGRISSLIAKRDLCLEEIKSEKENLFEILEDGGISEKFAKFETDSKSLDTYGHHFRVNRKKDNLLRDIANSREGERKGLKYLNVVSAGIRFTSSKLQTLSEEIKEILNGIKQEEAAIINEAVKVAVSFLSLFYEAVEIVAEIDVLQGFAQAALYAPTVYTRPRADPSTTMYEIKNARHPLLEVQDKLDIEYVPNDFTLRKGQSSFQLLRGPNMSGKSSTARTLALLSIMFQVGSFLPCDEGAVLPVIDGIYSRIGANDEQLKGISTFMSEMLDISSILSSCTDKSLVIVDELGRGTSTIEGFGIAYAVAERLIGIGCFCLFATHFHELSKLKNDMEATGKQIKLMHMSSRVINNEIVMMYKLKEAVDDDNDLSFGLNVARLVDFPPEVIRTSEEKHKQYVGDCAKMSYNESLSDRIQKLSQLIQASHD